MAKVKTKPAVKSPPVAPGNEFPVLNDDKSICTIGGLTLPVNQTIDFKPQLEERITLGKIVEFKYAGYRQENKSSVWMLLLDLNEKTNRSEWQSVQLWYDRFAKQIFEQQKPKANDTSAKPANPSQRPF